MFSKIILILALTVGISSSSAINLQKFHFSNSPEYATLEGSLLRDGHVDTDYKYILIGSYNYVRAPFVELDNNNRSRDIIRWMHTLNIGGAYRFTEKFQVGLSTFLTYQKAIPSDEDPSTAGYDKEFSLGDTTVDFKYKFYEKKRLAIAFTPRLYVNTGDEEYYTSNDEIGYYLGFALEKAFKYFQLTFNFGHKENKNAVFAQVDHEQQLHVALGGLVPLTEKLDLTAEFFRDTPYDSDNEQVPSELSVGVRYETSKSGALFGGVGTGSLDSDNSTDLRLYAGYKYFPGKGKVVPVAPIPVKKKKSKKIEKEEKSYGKFYKFLNVYFDTSSSKLTKLETMKLDEMIKQVKNEEKISKIVIEGYTSKVGSKQLNERLSNSRIKSVVEYISKRGVDVKLLQRVSYGSRMASDEDVNLSTDRKVMCRIYKTK